MTRITLILLSTLCVCQALAQPREQHFQLVLRDHWKMGPNDSLDPVVLSGPAFDAGAWYDVSVPTTIVGGLLANHVFPSIPFLEETWKS